MQTQRSYQFYGFHGTIESHAISILSSKEFHYGTPRDDHWLGKGAYFFKDDETQAKMWAIAKVKNHKNLEGENPVVIEVIINVHEANFLNLDTRHGIERLRDHLNQLKRAKLQIENTNQNQSSKKIRSFILSLLPDDIWIIQRTFPVDSVFDNDIMLRKMEFRLHGTQLCVRNNSIINQESIVLKEIVSNVKKPVRNKPRLINMDGGIKDDFSNKSG